MNTHIYALLSFMTVFVYFYTNKIVYFFPLRLKAMVFKLSQCDLTWDTEARC